MPVSFWLFFACSVVLGIVYCCEWIAAKVAGKPAKTVETLAQLIATVSMGLFGHYHNGVFLGLCIGALAVTIGCLARRRFLRR